MWKFSLKISKGILIRFMEGPLTKYGPIKFTQRLAIYKKNPIMFVTKR